jgi:hypothetical protein
MRKHYFSYGDKDEQRLKGTKAINNIWTPYRSEDMMEALFGYKLNTKGIPENFKLTNHELGTASGQMYVDPEYVTERTTKGYVSEDELRNGFEAAENHFSENPTENMYIYDSFKFHTYDHSSNIIYCLPFGLVYYKELDHE